MVHTYMYINGRLIAVLKEQILIDAIKCNRRAVRFNLNQAVTFPSYTTPRFIIASRDE